MAIMMPPEPQHDQSPDRGQCSWYIPGQPIAIPTTYRSCRFRSRLEARWAVFFDHMGIGWQYEPQGYRIGGRPYLPDFLLECGTWVEVKGNDQYLDRDLMRTAALALPQMPATGERGPKLMLLGPTPIPYLDPEPGDHAWLSIDPDGRGSELLFTRQAFGQFAKNRRPWWVDYADETDDGPWLRPSFHPDEPDTTTAYGAANGARFEHGERGAA